MSSLTRIYVDAPLSPGGRAALSEKQVHYLKNVLRRKPGDRVAVFNAVAGEFDAIIDELAKTRGAVSVGALRRGPEPEPDLWLLFAAVKRDALDRIAQKATELGVARLAPIRTERTNAARTNEERLAAIAVEAAEQCGRLGAPTVAPMERLDATLERWPGERRLMFCDEAGDDPEAEWGGREGRARPALEALAGEKAGPWAILIGPEGGFSPAERARLRALDYATPVTLGPRILRADTAAVAAIVLWQAALGDFRRA